MQTTYYLFSSGTLKRKDNTLTIVKEDGEKRDLPIEKIYDIYVFSDIVVNSDLFDFLGSKGICVHFFNYYGYYSGSFVPREQFVSGELLVKQVEHYLNFEKRAELARLFVKGASQNILRNLKYYNSRGKNIEQSIEHIESLQNDLDVFCNVASLMGVEGNIHKIYYSVWEEIINQDIDFEKRVKRPPDNMINCLISFLNSMVYTRTLSEIYKTHLNPTISYLHEPGSKRFSLSLDIAEIFKPLLTDRLIFSLLNKNVITEDDFDKSSESIRFKDKGMKKVVQAFDEAMLRTIKHRTLNQDVTYKHLIRLELYKLIKHLMGDKEYSPFKIWW